MPSFAAARDHRRAFAALAALVLATRLPGFLFGLLNIDECDFTILARAVTRGGRLYVDVADIKPPLAYLAFLPSGLAFDIWPMRVVGVLLCSPLRSSRARLPGPGPPTSAPAGAPPWPRCWLAWWSSPRSRPSW